jgi:hypothetical protein
MDRLARGKDRKGGQRGRGTDRKGGKTVRGQKGRETNREGGKIERGQRGRETNREGGKIERGEENRQGGGTDKKGRQTGCGDGGLIRCLSAVGSHLCPWALVVCRHTWGVVLVGGGLLHRWALVFVGGRRVEGSFSLVGGCCVGGCWVVVSVGARVRGWASSMGGPSSVGGCCVWDTRVRGWASSLGGLHHGGFSSSMGSCCPWGSSFVGHRLWIGVVLWWKVAVDMARSDERATSAG